MSKPIKALCKPGVIPSKPTKIENQTVQVEEKKPSDENNVFIFSNFYFFAENIFRIWSNGIIIFIKDGPKNY